MKNQSYIPIDCNFYDRLEAAAVKRENAVFEYFSDKEEKQETAGIIKDLYIREKVEYLILDSGVEIRLDRLIRMGEHFLPKTPFCDISVKRGKLT